MKLRECVDNDFLGDSRIEINIFSFPQNAKAFLAHPEVRLGYTTSSAVWVGLATLLLTPSWPVPIG
jgi:hypothetical protein